MKACGKAGGPHEKSRAGRDLTDITKSRGELTVDPVPLPHPVLFDLAENVAMVHDRRQSHPPAEEQHPGRWEAGHNPRAEVEPEVRDRPPMHHVGEDCGHQHRSHGGGPRGWEIHREV